MARTAIFIGEVMAAYSREAVDPLVYVDGEYISPLNSGAAE